MEAGINRGARESAISIISIMPCWEEIRLTSSLWANGPFLLEDPAFWGLCLLHTFSEVCCRVALRPWCCWAPVQSFCEGFWLTLLRWSFLVLSEITFLLYLVHTNAFSCSVSLLESSWFILFYYHPQPTFLTKGSVTRIRPPSSLVKPHRQEKGCFLLDTDRPGLKDLLPHHDNMGQHSMLDCLTQMSTWPGPEPLDT